LDPWQSDAVRRLFQKQTLDAGDYDDRSWVLCAQREACIGCRCPGRLL